MRETSVDKMKADALNQLQSNGVRGQFWKHPSKQDDRLYVQPLDGKIEFKVWICWPDEGKAFVGEPKLRCFMNDDAKSGLSDDDVKKEEKRVWVKAAQLALKPIKKIWEDSQDNWDPDAPVTPPDDADGDESVPF